MKDDEKEEKKKFWNNIDYNLNRVIVVPSSKNY